MVEAPLTQRPKLTLAEKLSIEWWAFWRSPFFGSAPSLVALAAWSIAVDLVAALRR